MKKSILIVDKDPFILMAYKRILNKDKINVISAFSIEQVKLKHKKKKPLLILFDMDYKNMHKNYINDIKKLFPNVPIILSTAFSNTITNKMAIEMGADYYFTKPFNIPDMLKNIHKIMNT